LRKKVKGGKRRGGISLSLACLNKIMRDKREGKKKKDRRKPISTGPKIDVHRRKKKRRKEKAIFLDGLEKRKKEKGGQSAFPIILHAEKGKKKRGRKNVAARAAKIRKGRRGGEKEAAEKRSLSSSWHMARTGKRRKKGIKRRPAPSPSTIPPGRTISEKKEGERKKKEDGESRIILSSSLSPIRFWKYRRDRREKKKEKLLPRSLNFSSHSLHPRKRREKRERVKEKEGKEAFIHKSLRSKKDRERKKRGPTTQEILFQVGQLEPGEEKRGT